MSDEWLCFHGKYSVDNCEQCAVLSDYLETVGCRFGVNLSNLTTGLSYHSSALRGWSLADVVAIPRALTDGKDEPNFTWILGLRDGRWLALRGWHDYTGWDCQSGLRAEWYASQEDAERTLVDWERAAMGAAS